MLIGTTRAVLSISELWGLSLLLDLLNCFLVLE